MICNSYIINLTFQIKRIKNETRKVRRRADTVQRERSKIHTAIRVRNNFIAYCNKPMDR